MNFCPDVLVLGPGGIKGFLELGFLLYLEEKELLHKINTIIGVSIGAIIGLLMVSGLSIAEIIEAALEMDILRDLCDISADDIKNRSGILSGESMKIHLSQKIESKLGFVPTLEQLYNYSGKKFICVSTNLDTNEPVYISHENKYFRNLSCVEAVLFSSNIPYIFQKIVYRGATYIDGAFSNPYPVDLMDDGKNCIIGIYVISDVPPANVSFIAYCQKVLYSAIARLRMVNIERASKNCIHVQIKTNRKINGLFASFEDKSSMISTGYKRAIEFISGSYSEKGPILIEDINEPIPIYSETSPKDTNIKK